jgi:hypothetical protein
MLPHDVCSSMEQLKGKVDNIAVTTGDFEQINSWKLMQETVIISLLRYVPHALKPSFWTSSVASVTGFSDIIESSRYTINDLAFFHRLKTTGLSLQNEKNSYTVHYLFAPHPPNKYNEFAEFVASGVGIVQNARGVLRIVEEYLQQMKKLGIYDQANIIITADHGNYPESYHKANASCIFMIKRAGESHDVVQVSNAPVSQYELLPTLALVMGLDNLNLGRSVFDFIEGEERTRTTYRLGSPTEFPDLGIKKKRGGGKGYYNALVGYEFNTHATEVNLSLDDESKIVYPLFDSYY